MASIHLINPAQWPKRIYRSSVTTAYADSKSTDTTIHVLMHAVFEANRNTCLTTIQFSDVLKNSLAHIFDRINQHNFTSHGEKIAKVGPPRGKSQGNPGKIHPLKALLCYAIFSAAYLSRNAIARQVAGELHSVTWVVSQFYCCTKRCTK